MIADHEVATMNEDDGSKHFILNASATLLCKVYNSKSDGVLFTNELHHRRHYTFRQVYEREND